MLSNFCPSITDNEEARQQVRYRNGEDYLRAHEVNASLAYCSALSDTMHVCRSRNGDGTLLTSIWDTKDGVVNLYFYHSYDNTVRFNLSEELAKGDRVIDVSTLFPRNAAFERLKSYKTPFNTPGLRVLLVFIAGFLSLGAFLLALISIKRKSSGISFKNGLAIALLNLILIAYLFVLATNVGIYYFDTPYRDYSSIWISMSSYIPFLLAAVIIPISWHTLRRYKSVNTKGWIKAILVSNNLLYFVLISSFAYWGLYSFWN